MSPLSVLKQEFSSRATTDHPCVAFILIDMADASSWGDPDEDDDGGDFETRLAALDQGREYALRSLLTSLNERLYCGAPFDPSVRVGDGHGTFSVAAPQAEMEWQALNSLVRVAGWRALGREGILLAPPDSRTAPQVDTEESLPALRPPGYAHGTLHGGSCDLSLKACIGPDCALVAELVEAFKVYDGLQATQQSGAPLDPAAGEAASDARAHA